MSITTTVEQVESGVEEQEQERPVTRRRKAKAATGGGKVRTISQQQSVAETRTKLLKAIVQKGVSHQSDRHELATSLRPLWIGRLPLGATDAELEALAQKVGVFGDPSRPAPGGEPGRLMLPERLVLPELKDTVQWVAVARSQAADNANGRGLAAYFASLDGKDADRQEFLACGYHVGVFPLFAVVDMDARGNFVKRSYENGLTEFFFTAHAYMRNGKGKPGTGGGVRKQLRVAAVTPVAVGDPYTTQGAKADGYSRGAAGYGIALDEAIRLGNLDRAVANLCALAETVFPWFAPLDANRWTAPALDEEYHALNDGKREVNATVERVSLRTRLATPMTSRGAVEPPATGGHAAEAPANPLAGISQEQLLQALASLLQPK